jgi:DNA-binding response OmpR family regulator
MQHILVVEDDPINTRLLKFLLEDEGYQVTTTASPREALEQIEEEQPDMLVLDVMLQEMDGLELCRHIRARSQVPILFLSGRSEIKDIIAGLQAGGDDYLAKPYDPNEVIARVWALLRRSLQLANSQSNLSNSDLILDPTNNKVRLHRTGQTILLTPLESRLLQVLMSQPGRTLTRDALVIKVWGYDYDTMSNQLDVYISRLRTKLEADPSEPTLIQTIRSIGYRLQPSRLASTVEKQRESTEAFNHAGGSRDDEAA